MKKILVLFIATLLVVFSTTGVFATTVFEDSNDFVPLEKTVEIPLIDDDFRDNEIFVVLTEEATYKVRMGEMEYTPETFNIPSIIQIRKHNEQPTAHYILYTLILSEHSKENVITVIKELGERDDIIVVCPIYNKIATNPCDEDNQYKISPKTVSLKAGSTKKLKVSSDTVKNWKSSNKKVATVKNGKVTALKRGTATITATLKSGKKLTSKITVTSNPKLSKKSVKVSKNKTVSVKITGKAKTIKNIYTSSKYAKIISKKSATTLKVRGLKKGTTTVKIKINGVKTLKLKVKVI